MEQVDIPDIEVVEADAPYGSLPRLPYSGSVLGWYRRRPEYKIYLSDVCEGEPPIDETVKVISHEFLHHILETLVSSVASVSLDNIVSNGDYVAEREENGHHDDRPLSDRWR